MKTTIGRKESKLILKDREKGAEMIASGSTLVAHGQRTEEAFWECLRKKSGFAGAVRFDIVDGRIVVEEMK
jgi:hypothetical protein